MLFLNEHQVRTSLNVDEVIRALHEAFARDFHLTLKMPVRTQLDAGPSILLLMPCHDSERNAAGVKIVTVNPDTGVNATYALLDPATGKTLAVMEANYLTDLRTAATSAVATDLLARPDAQVLGVFGTGRQAKAHLIALPRVRPFRRFLVCGSGRSDPGGFCKMMREEHGIEVEPVSAETCARESDVLCTCTTSHVPLFDGRLLRPGTHLNLVGAFQTHTREVDDETAKRSRIVVDTEEGALEEAGDLLIPLNNGVIARDQIVADLHQIASGKKPGRPSPEDITLFKSVGCALEDLVTANLLWKHFVK
ncbi:MAG TPA: ornithine cyclodeaminase family protein [Candidatus Angelobacter sp.]|nr:ornithine cyclodeaminase family protein [Candidatus Angelobacter sp.]